MSLITDHTCAGQTLVDRIKFWGVTNPERDAFIFWSPAGKRSMSRGDVLDLSSRFAYRLIQNGVKPGDAVCTDLPNSPERVVVQYGTVLAGAVTMNGQVLRTDGEDLIETLNKAKCAFMVLDPDQSSGSWQVCRHAFDNYQIYDDHVDIQSERIPFLTKAFISRQSGHQKGLLDSLHEEGKEIYEKATPKDVCTIFTTSGSTGYSKLVPQSHEAILTFGNSMCEILDLKQGKQVLNGSPLGWGGGFPAPYLYSGCTRVALDESFGKISDKPALIWDVLCKENIKSAFLLPAFIETVCGKSKDTSKQQGSHTLSRIMTGGQPINKEILGVIGNFTDSITVVYASTEFAIGSRMYIDVDSISRYQNNMTGYPLTGIQLKIVDKDLTPVPPLSRGEILLKSPILFTGYIGEDVSAQKNLLPGGWFRTGDIGFLREDGCLFVEGRSSDAIMHGAYILYPTWMEKMLIKCPGVKDVVIVPVPDKALHHEICACIKLDEQAENHPSREDVISFCQKETVLDASSSLNVIPKYVLFFKDFPQTNTSKLDRKRLATEAREKLQL